MFLILSQKLSPSCVFPGHSSPVYLPGRQIRCGPVDTEVMARVSSLTRRKEPGVANPLGAVPVALPSFQQLTSHAGTAPSSLSEDKGGEETECPERRGQMREDGGGLCAEPGSQAGGIPGTRSLRPGPPPACVLCEH